MGKYDKGILGNIRGKVGTVIGSRWKGIEYLRSLSGPRRSGPSAAQQQQQALFGYGVRFLQPFHPVVRIGYRTQVKKKTPINAALSDLLTNVVTGSYPNYQVDYNRFRVAKGTLAPPSGCQVQIDNGEIQFTWSPNSQNGEAHDDDATILLACGEDLWPTFSIQEYSRADGSGRLSLPVAETGQTIYCYLAFAGTGDNKAVSNSLLAGTVVIP